jgi:hypothetical protein
MFCFEISVLLKTAEIDDQDCAIEAEFARRMALLLTTISSDSNLEHDSCNASVQSPTEAQPPSVNSVMNRLGFIIYLEPTAVPSYTPSSDLLKMCDIGKATGKDAECRDTERNTENDVILEAFSASREGQESQDMIKTTKMEKDDKNIGTLHVVASSSKIVKEEDKKENSWNIVETVGKKKKSKK